jgi:hypothetical protein
MIPPDHAAGAEQFPSVTNQMATEFIYEEA